MFDPSAPPAAPSAPPAANGPAPVGKQLEFAAMPTRLFQCTPSKLTAFDCPRRYRLTYVDSPRPPRGGPWAHNTMGAAVHVALRQWYDLAVARRTPDSGAALVHSTWQSDGFRDDEQSGLWRHRAAEWVRRYLEDVDPDQEPIGVERTVSTPTARLALSGRVDRIDERGGELVIVDYKTGRAVPGPDDARGSLALAIYAIAAARTLRRPCRRVELHHLPSGAVVGHDHTPQSLERHVRRAEEAADDIVTRTDTLAAVGTSPQPQDNGPAAREQRAAADDLFPAVTGPQCAWCDMRRNCPDGQSATRAREPWAGLPEPTA